MNDVTLLRSHQEPIFALLATDPTSANTSSGRTFAEIGAELLAPKSYGSYHHTTATFLGHPDQCSGCAPFAIMARAAVMSEGAVDPDPTGVLPIEPTAIVEGKGRRRETARSFGPASKRR